MFQTWRLWSNHTTAKERNRSKMGSVSKKSLLLGVAGELDNIRSQWSDISLALVWPQFEAPGPALGNPIRGQCQAGSLTGAVHLSKGNLKT